MNIAVFVTTPDMQTAKTIALKLLQERLAACVSINEEIKSLYWWKDKIEEAAECQLIIKTKLGLFEELEKAVNDLHPYEVPEIIALPIVTGFKPYLAWLGRETGTAGDDMDFWGVQF